MGSTSFNKSRTIFGGTEMNILMVYPEPDINKKPRFGFSYDLLLTATILSKFHKVYIHDYSCEQFSNDVFEAEIECENYDIVFIECDSFALKRSENLSCARKILGLLKNKAISICYGNYCYIKKQPFETADYTVTNNEINEIIRLVNQIDKQTIIPEISSYDELPYIDRSLLNHIEFYIENSYNTLLQTSKGCENTCIFCQRKGWQSKYIAHSDDYVLGEIRLLKELGYKNVWITDENFTFNLKRSKRLLRKIADLRLENAINFFISSWANIDFELIDLAHKCNVRIISFGIESANVEILKFYRKNICLEQIIPLIKYANSKGIFTVGNFIIGAPMETHSSIRNTFSLIRECGFDQVNIKNLDYMIGSELYERLTNSLKEKNHVFACSENGLTKFTLNEIKEYKTQFLSDYYKEHKEILIKKIKVYGRPYDVN